MTADKNPIMTTEEMAQLPSWTAVVEELSRVWSVSVFRFAGDDGGWLVVRGIADLDADGPDYGRLLTLLPRQSVEEAFRDLLLRERIITFRQKNEIESKRFDLAWERERERSLLRIKAGVSA